MKRFLMVGVLVGLLAVSAFAGDSSTSGSPAPAPGGATETTDPGDIPSVGKAELSSEALSALLSVLSFLAA
jgi:hypothetical protein